MRILGKGATRKVFDRGDGTVEKHIIRKSRRNEQEWKNWLKLKDTQWSSWVAPCISFEDGVVVKIKAEPLKLSGEILLPKFFRDVKTDNFGMIGNRIVMVDYADMDEPNTDEMVWRKFKPTK